MGFLLATVAVPAQATALAADGLVFLRESTLAWIALWTTVGAFRRVSLIARVIGFIMVLLGGGVLTIALARLKVGSAPDAAALIGYGAIAFGAQLVAGVLALRYRQERASFAGLWLIVRDSCMVHLMVIVAGLSVLVTESNIGDIAIGAASDRIRS
jgi:hypothetical protein